MDNEVKEILMHLVDTTNKLIEGQKQMSADISDLKKDVAEIKEEAQITRSAVNHNGEVLENLTDQLTALHYVDVKY